MNPSTQSKIQTIVAAYQTECADEYNLFRQEFSARKSQLDTTYAALNKGDGTVMRELFTIPETLAHMLKTALTDAEYQEIWHAGKHADASGARWFAKSFPQYRLAQKL